MEWVTVISLILIGIALVVVEIIFVPGTTFVGIVGFCMVLAGIIASFSFFDEGELNALKSGEEGITVSALRPSGKADIQGKLYEVTTLGNFVSSGSRIKIVRISSNQIIVEPIN